MLEHPARDDLAVVEPGGKRMLGREPVLDRHHGCARAVRELARDVVHHADAPDGEPAAVEVHDDTSGRLVVLVHAHSDTVDHLIGDLRDFARGRPTDWRSRELHDLRGEVLEGHHRIGLQPFGNRRIEDAFVGHVIMSFSRAGVLQLRAE